MEKKIGWVKSVLFGICLTVMAVLCMPMAVFAENYAKFGDIITANVWYNKKSSVVSYNIEKNGILTISSVEKVLNTNLIVRTAKKDNIGAEIMMGLEDTTYALKVGVRAGDVIEIETWATSEGSTWNKYVVSFEEEKYCETMDEAWNWERGVPQVKWAKSGTANRAIQLTTKDVMYKGFLHGRENKMSYDYYDITPSDDVDTWNVTLQENGDYKIYFDGLDGVKKAATGSYFITFSTPTQTYHKIQNALKYDNERNLYYYPYKADKTGTYDIRIGGIFRDKRNISYSLGVYEDFNGWIQINGKDYWYENNIRQGYDPGNPSYRGKEIYDPGSDAWYWLDNVQGGAKAVSKDVYQESNGGKWVRYDYKGSMVKGWNDQNGKRYYFDLVTGAMYKGLHNISGQEYYFDDTTGGLYTGWISRDGKDYWYENGIQQGLEGRGKEIYDPGTKAWYWLDSVYGGAKAVNKEVYQETNGGKWVRYNANGHMIKGWHTVDGKTYYYDQKTGAMQKGWVRISGGRYHFDENTGVLLQ